MIVHDVAQSSPEWLDLRCGIPTASQFKRIITAKTEKPSAGADKYLDELMAEHIDGHIDGFDSEFMERGKKLEAEAANWYALQHDIDPVIVGFVTTDDGDIGCSPDRLIGDEGGLEIKVPALTTHIGYERNPDSLVAAYRPQVYGCMWLCERLWWDILSYNPAMQSVCVRVTREDEYMAKLIDAVTKFSERLETERKELIDRGA